MSELRFLSLGISLALHASAAVLISRPNSFSAPKTVPSIILSFEKKELEEESKQKKEKLFDKPQMPTQKKSVKRYHDDGPLEKKESKGGAPKIRAASGNLEPEYPFEARQKGLEATVRLILKVNQSGKVEKVDVLTKNLPDCFIQSAIKAAKSWRFIVQEELTSPLVDVEVPFTFKLLEES